MENVINYIIDHKGYGNVFQLTNVRTGECNDLDRYQALDYLANLQHKTFFSTRADVQLRSVEQVEVPSSRDAWFDGLINSVEQVEVV